MESGIRGVGDVGAVVGDRAMSWLGHGLDDERVTVRIGVVAQHVDRHRHVLVGGIGVVLGHGRIVHRKHGHLNGRERRASVSVARGVRERIDTVEPGIGSVEHVVAVVDHGSMGRLRDGLDGQRVAVGIVIVLEHIDRDRCVLVCAHAVVACVGGVVQGSDGDGHAGRRSSPVPVGDRVGEGVDAVEVGIRGVRDAVSVVGDRAVVGLSRRLNGEAIAVWIGVVDQHVDIDRRVFAGPGGVVLGEGRIVHRVHGHRDRGGRGTAVSIGGGVGERVHAVEVGVGDVGDVVTVVDRLAVRRRRDPVDE